MQENISDSFNDTENQENGEDLKYLLFRYLRFWPWFLLSVLMFVSGAYLYLRYSTNIYRSQAKVKVLDESNDGGLDLSGLSGSKTLFNLSKVNLENEIQIFKSRRMLEKVIENLDLTTVYSSQGAIKSFLIFNEEAPIEIDWVFSDSTYTQNSPLFKITPISENNFKLSSQDRGETEGKFGEPLSFAGFSLVVRKKSETYQFNKELYFRYVTKDRLIRQLSSTISLEPIGEKSHILMASVQGENKNRNEAILDELIRQFNQDGIEDKRLISKRTQEFIEERLVFLVEELDTVETGLVDFKRSNDVVTIESSAEQLFGKEAGAETKRYEVETQLAITQELNNSLTAQGAYQLLPANIGIQDAKINELTQRYNEIILERDRLLVSSTEENPVILNLQQKLDRLEENIMSSVNAYIRSLSISLKSLTQREQVSSGKLGGLPAKEKKLRDIRRQQEIKERLYLFLLQRREEAALSYAITSPVIKVVDWAYTQPGPVAPNRQVILLGGLIMGLILPFGILYVRFLLDTKIHSKSQIQRKLPQIAVVGEIPSLDKKDELLIKENDRSVLAEAFRILRTNLNFFTHQKEKGKIIFVTSTTKGEGKTFVAVNLANSIASTRKKALLIGADLRNPQIHTYVNQNKNQTGVTNYLYNKSLQLEDIIQYQIGSFKNLDIILSGAIPPNPAELLLNGRFQELLEQAKQAYDYIIVDTAPTILVTDTLLISQLADATMYMVRAGYTDVKLLSHIEELKKQNKLTNVGLVLNDVQAEGAYGYNYGYGYGYSEEVKKKPVWKFWGK